MLNKYIGHGSNFRARGSISIGQGKNWESGMFILAISRFIGLEVELPVIPSVNYGDTKLFK